MRPALPLLALALCSCASATAPIELAVGAGAYLSLRDGSVRAWGLSLFTDNSTGHGAVYLEPVAAPLVAGLRGFSFGDGFACALAPDATARCWGNNDYGQLGDGTTEARAQPVTVAGLSDAVQLTQGTLHSCALRRDGTVWCWGSNLSGQLGHPPEQSEGCGLDPFGFNPLMPGEACNRTAQQVPGLTAVRAIDAGPGGTCALRNDGSVWCWGRNQNGQLGVGSTSDYRSTPEPVANLADAVEVQVGMYFSCARLRDGTAQCWGINQGGELGDGTTTDRSLAAPVQGLARVTQLSLGWHHACARLDDGTARCWGAGPVGDGVWATHTTPVPASGLTGVAEVRAGFDSSCARLDSGAVWCWGANLYGALGDGTQTNRLAPVAVRGFE